MQRKEKRYYKVGEKVWVKEENALGVITDLDIRPSENTFQAVVEVGAKEMKVNLWEIDKNKRTVFKHKRKSQPTLLFAKINPNSDAKIPSKEEENGGYDLYPSFEENFMVLQPHSVTLIPTGIASSVKDDWVLIVKERGSTGVKGMSVRAGVVDSGYRGEIFVALNNTTDKPIIIAKKDAIIETDSEVVVYPYEKAIAQLLMLPVPKVYVKEISYDKLKEIPSKRGAGKLGDSGK